MSTLAYGFVVVFAAAMALVTVAPVIGTVSLAFSHIGTTLDVISHR